MTAPAPARRQHSAKWDDSGVVLAIRNVCLSEVRRISARLHSVDTKVVLGIHLMRAWDAQKDGARGKGTNLPEEG